MNTATQTETAKAPVKVNSVAAKAPNHRGWYANVWPNWVTKALGAQPTNDQLGIIHALGARPGKQAMAIAMALRDCGVTGNQIKTAASLFDGAATPQLNKMRGMVDQAGTLAWVPMPASGDGKVYRVKVTERGKQVIKAMGDRPLHATPSLKAAGTKPGKAPAKAKGLRLTSRAKTPKVKPATAPAATPAPVQAKPATEPVKPVTHTVLTEKGPVTLAGTKPVDGK